MCILPLGENGLEKYRLKWEQFKIVILFMDHPVYVIGLAQRVVFFLVSLPRNYFLLLLAASVCMLLKLYVVSSTANTTLNTPHAHNAEKFCFRALFSAKVHRFQVLFCIQSKCLNHAAKCGSELPVK